MEALLNVISSSIDGFIIVLGVAMLGGMIVIAGKLANHKHMIEVELNGRLTETVVDPDTLSVTKKKAEPVERGTVYKMKREFDGICTWYLRLSQIIPVFPLLGILGTVAGLMMQVNAQADVQLIYTSLDTALSSTLYGLIAAIVLKVLTALWHVPSINAIENIYSDYDREFHDAIDMGNLEKR